MGEHNDSKRRQPIFMELGLGGSGGDVVKEVDG